MELPLLWRISLRGLPSESGYKLQVRRRTLEFRWDPWGEIEWGPKGLPRHGGLFVRCLFYARFQPLWPSLSSTEWLWTVTSQGSNRSNKTCCFWILMLEKTFESPLDCKEIKTVHPKGNQLWIFTGKTDAKAEALIVLATWCKESTHWKRPWCWKYWGQEEMGTTEDEMIGRHHQVKEHEFEQTSGDSDGQGSLVWCSPWGHRVRHDWAATEKQQKIKGGVARKSKVKGTTEAHQDEEINHLREIQFSSVQSSHSVMSDSLRTHEPQHARPPCPSPTLRVYSNSCPRSRWCHPAISSSIIPFSCPQSFLTSGSFQMSQLFAPGGESIGVSASTLVLSMNIQDWFPLRLTGLISLQSKGLSRVFSNSTVQMHQFFGAQLSSQSNSHIHTRPLVKLQPWLDGPLLTK